MANVNPTKEHNQMDGIPTIGKPASINQQFAYRLRETRQKAGLTQEELAAGSGLHVTYISGLESGRRNPTLSVLGRLSNALKIPLSELLEGVDWQD